jgi:hypothetical protein
VTSYSWFACSESIELIERARSQAILARRHLRAHATRDDDGSELLKAKRLLIAASQALGAAAMDSALPTKVTNALVDSWAGLDAFLLAAGELDEEPTGADAYQLLSRAASFLLEAVPDHAARARVAVR